jgi:hypothetical protein
MRSYQDLLASLNPVSKLSNVVEGVGSFFSKIGLQARQRPDRRNCIVIFVLGEITWNEVREILDCTKEIQAKVKGVRILLAACRIAKSSVFLNRFCKHIIEKNSQSQ